jgi:hypothetical protein
MSEFCNFKGSIPEVSKTFIHLSSILKITFFVITFFSKVPITYRIRTFGQKLFKQVSQASTSQVEEALGTSTKVVLDYFIIFIITKLIGKFLTMVNKDF